MIAPASLPPIPSHTALGEPPRRRVLQVAFACHPDQSMESRIGWHRAVHAAAAYNVTVMHADSIPSKVLRLRAEELGLGDRIRFVQVQNSALGRALSRSATSYYAGYRLWHSAAYRIARRMHQESPFDLVHQTTFCGYREPGLCWRLDAPFVWGPVGGTQGFPVAYLGQLGPRDAWIELCRNAINAWQIRRSRRVRLAAQKASVLLAATRRGRDDLHRALGVEAEVCLETAIATGVEPPKPPRQPDAPLRVLWAGRLRAWKTLPLLLRALARLPRDVPFELRVLGVGCEEDSWRRAAHRLGLAGRVTWLGWPDYYETLPQYRWADCFAFTSMRDTSGTGLIEALAAGTPIVGVDHQGAADIMTDDCAIRVGVGSPGETIDAIARGIERLWRDAELLGRLGEGARLRAASMTWDHQAERLLDWYARALGDHRPATRATVRCAARRPGEPFESLVASNA